MITNQEIMRNQLNRINEKSGANLALAKKKGLYALIEAGSENGEMPYKAPNMFIGYISWRTATQMIDYLAGLEDAIDHYTGQKE